LNLGIHGERLASNRLSHGIATIDHYPSEDTNLEVLEGLYWNVIVVQVIVLLLIWEVIGLNAI
jgi:hypothetical protein